MPFEMGKQVVYVPNHAYGDISHPDAEYGFVTEDRSSVGVVFCRFFKTEYVEPEYVLIKNPNIDQRDEMPYIESNEIAKPGYHKTDTLELRTTANSESVDIKNLVRVDHRSNADIKGILKALGYLDEVDEVEEVEAPTQGVMEPRGGPK